MSSGQANIYLILFVIPTSSAASSLFSLTPLIAGELTFARAARGGHETRAKTQQQWHCVCAFVCVHLRAIDRLPRLAVVRRGRVVVAVSLPEPLYTHTHTKKTSPAKRTGDKSPDYIHTYSGQARPPTATRQHTRVQTNSVRKSCTRAKF